MKTSLNSRYSKPHLRLKLDSRFNVLVNMMEEDSLSPIGYR